MDLDIQELLRRASEPVAEVSNSSISEDNDALYSNTILTPFTPDEAITPYLSAEDQEREERKRNARQETIRFSRAEWFQKVQEKVIVVVGVGGIGSWLSLLLGKLHPAGLFLFDPDVVETVNMAGQLYSIDDVGKTKVSALFDTIKNYGGYNRTNILPQKFDSSYTADIMFTGLDNMAARSECYHAWKRHIERKETNEEKAKCLFIDGRLTANQLQVLCFTGTDDYYMRQYEERFIFSDDEAEHLACSFKQTAFMANMIASIMVNLFVNFCANECDTNLIRSLPFFTEYYSDLMLFSEEK